MRRCGQAVAAHMEMWKSEASGMKEVGDCQREHVYISKYNVLLELNATCQR